MIAEPLNENDLSLKIDGNDHAVIIAFDIENNSVSRNDAGRRKLPFYIAGVRPIGARQGYQRIASRLKAQ